MKTTCQAKPGWWTSDIFRPFYLEKAKSGDLDSRVDAAERIEIINEIQKDRMKWRGQVWVIPNISIIWTQGSMAGLPDVIRGDHWHTDFSLNEHVIHVDYVSFFRGGPQTGYREYRIFVDQKEEFRGGGFMGFLGGSFARLRNFPLAYTIDDYLIYGDNALQYWPRAVVGKLDYPDAMSLWQMKK